MRSLDTNQDGVIDPAEIPEERKRMFGFMAQRFGLDPGQKVPIDRVVEAMRNRFSGGPPQPGGGSPGGPVEGSSESRGSKQEAEPLVPGFGVPPEANHVAQFGERIGPESPDAPARSGRASGSSAARSSSRASSRGSSGSSSSSVSEKTKLEYKVRAYAKSLLKRYDKNKSGVLEKDEWGQMKIDPKGTDRNNDGVITLDELAAKLVNYSKSRSGGSGSSASGSSASGSGGASRSDEPGLGRRSYRLRSPIERLPGDLPGWFIELDDNGDGQVSMAEHATRWSDSEARGFLDRDLNNDGMITADECLAIDSDSDSDSNSGSDSDSSRSRPDRGTAPGSRGRRSFGSRR